MEIKAKCINNYSEFQKGKLYKLVKDDYTGVRVYINDIDFIYFNYSDYGFYFIDIVTHRDTILDDILGPT